MKLEEGIMGHGAKVDSSSWESKEMGAVLKECSLANPL